MGARTLEPTLIHPDKNFPLGVYQQTFATPFIKALITAYHFRDADRDSISTHDQRTKALTLLPDSNKADYEHRDCTGILFSPQFSCCRQDLIDSPKEKS